MEPAPDIKAAEAGDATRDTAPEGIRGGTPSPRRAAAEGAARGEAGKRGAAKPPALNFHLARHLKLLALCNVIPLIGGAWLWWQWSHGNLHFRTPTGKEWPGVCAVVIASGIVLALSCWLLMPLARWLRSYPAWHFQHANKVVWFVPLIGGWLGWLALSLTAIATVLACLAAMGIGLWRLFAALP